MFSFELSSFILKVFFADFEYIFVLWGRYRITIAALRITEKPYPAKNPYSKSKTQMLKQDVKFVKS